MTGLSIVEWLCRKYDAVELERAVERSARGNCQRLLGPDCTWVPAVVHGGKCGTLEEFREAIARLRFWECAQ